jgi:hypothetical protein
MTLGGMRRFDAIAVPSARLRTHRELLQSFKVPANTRARATAALFLFPGDPTLVARSRGHEDSCSMRSRGPPCGDLVALPVEISWPSLWRSRGPLWKTRGF